MIDIDHFKRVNGRYGHGVGDQVIHAVARRLRRAVRSIELIGRYGGEEFALILPDITGGAGLVGERIRAAIADTRSRPTPARCPSRSASAWRCSTPPAPSPT